jgi:hypothetical protein
MTPRNDNCLPSPFSLPLHEMVALNGCHSPADKPPPPDLSPPTAPSPIKGPGPCPPSIALIPTSFPNFSCSKVHPCRSAPALEGSLRHQPTSTALPPELTIGEELGDLLILLDHLRRGIVPWSSLVARFLQAAAIMAFPIHRRPTRAAVYEPWTESMDLSIEK